MLSDTDSSDSDDLMVPNGFVDVGADTVECDFDQKYGNTSPPSKKKRGRKGKASISTSFDCESPADKPSSTPNTTTTADVGSIEILDDSLGVLENSQEDASETGVRRSKRKTRSSFSGSVKQKKKNVSIASVLNESDSVVVSSPEPEESQQSSFCFELEDDVCASIIEDDASTEEEVKVRVVWKGCETKYFNLRKHQKIKEIYAHFAQQEGIEEDRILLTLHDKAVFPHDTPTTLNIGVASLEGGITDVATSNRATENGDSEAPVDPNALKLFIQRKGVKEKHTVYTFPYEKISVLMSKLSEDLKIPTSSFILKFDGETLSPDDTPESLDMEGEECVDLMEIK